LIFTPPEKRIPGRGGLREEPLEGEYGGPGFIIKFFSKPGNYIRKQTCLLDKCELAFSEL